MYHLQILNNIENAKPIEIVGGERLINRICGLQYLGGFKRFEYSLMNDDSPLKKSPKEIVVKFINEVFITKEAEKVKEFLNGFIKL
jgi:hypothetical protein